MKRTKKNCWQSHQIIQQSVCIPAVRRHVFWTQLPCLVGRGCGPEVPELRHGIPSPDQLLCEHDLNSDQGRTLAAGLNRSQLARSFHVIPLSTGPLSGSLPSLGHNRQNDEDIVEPHWNFMEVLNAESVRPGPHECPPEAHHLSCAWCLPEGNLPATKTRWLIQGQQVLDFCSAQLMQCLYIIYIYIYRLLLVKYVCTNAWSFHVFPVSWIRQVER